MNNWNPLYPLDEDVSPIEEAAREAEWEDDLKAHTKPPEAEDPSEYSVK